MEERGGDFPGQVEERPGRATSGGSGGAWVRIIMWFQMSFVEGVQSKNIWS